MNAQPRNPQIVQEFTARRTRQWIASGLAVLVIFAIMWLEQHPGLIDVRTLHTMAGPSMVIVLGGLVAFSFFNWRCPACQTYLGKGWNPKFCARCGEALQ